MLHVDSCCGTRADRPTTTNRLPYLSGETSPRDIGKGLRVRILQIPKPMLLDSKQQQQQSVTEGQPPFSITAGVELGIGQ